jgi:DNA-binding NtrC family response regulator
MIGTPPPVILLAEDDARTREGLSRAITREGYRALGAASGAEALAVLSKEPVDLLLTDLRMPGIDGMTLLERVRADFPATVVVIVTGYATVDVAVQAMRNGAYDFLTKPIQLDKLDVLVKHALEARRLTRENRELKLRLRETSGLKQLLGHSSAMDRLRDMIEQVAQTDATVLILGESGTGKELVAEGIHYGGPRADGPLVKVSCAALPEGLLESELFGHERGAFTGARDRHKGRFELAHGGTLFLDEIGDLNQQTQAKLLRALQEQEFERVGGTETLQVDVRLIAATNRDLEGLMAEGTFREDLYYRLNVVVIDVPPLRERIEDVPVLVAHFLRRFARRWGKPAPEITPECLALLCRHPWRGNVRELQHVVESMVVFSKGDSIEAANLPPAIRGNGRISESDERPAAGTLQDLERQAIAQTLVATGGNKRKAAEILGIGLKTLYRRAQEFGLQ